MAERLGFVGLGIMGKPMARNLLRAGFPVTVHSRGRGPVEESARVDLDQLPLHAEVEELAETGQDAVRHDRGALGKAGK